MLIFQIKNTSNIIVVVRIILKTMYDRNNMSTVNITISVVIIMVENSRKINHGSKQRLRALHLSFVRTCYQRLTDS